MIKKHKDPHYVVKVEKAITKKYGKETIQNPKKDWNPEKEKEYQEQIKEFYRKRDKIKDKTEKVEVDGVFIPKKLLNKRKERTCPICETYSFKKKDDVYIFEDRGLLYLNGEDVKSKIQILSSLAFNSLINKSKINFV